MGVVQFSKVPRITRSCAGSVSRPETVVLRPVAAKRPFVPGRGASWANQAYEAGQSDTKVTQAKERFDAQISAQDVELQREKAAFLS